MVVFFCIIPCFNTNENLIIAIQNYDKLLSLIIFQIVLSNLFIKIILFFNVTTQWNEYLNTLSFQQYFPTIGIVIVLLFSRLDFLLKIDDLPFLIHYPFILFSLNFCRRDINRCRFPSTGRWNWKNPFFFTIQREYRASSLKNCQAKQRESALWQKKRERERRKSITCWTIRINDPFVAFNVVGTGPAHLYQF